MPKALVLTLVALALALAGCGSADDQTATIGTSEVTISGDEEPESFAELFGLLMEKTPYLPSYSHCLEGQVEEAISGDQEEELLELPERRPNGASPS